MIDETLMVNNPDVVQNSILNLIKDRLEGVELEEFSTPFGTNIEANIMTTMSLANQYNDGLRKLYPSKASDHEELYKHLVDNDLLNVFARPGRAYFTMLLDLEEVKAIAPKVDEDGTKLIVIPKHSRITVSDLDFTLPEAINITVKPHGALDVRWDVHPEGNQVESLPSNIVEWTIRNTDSARFLDLTIPLRQYRVAETTFVPNQALSYRREIEFSDRFYFVEAWYRSGSEWVRMTTTYSEDIYSPESPTLLVKPLSQKVRLIVPPIYVDNKIIKDSVKIKLYTTLGDYRVDLANYTEQAYSATWNTTGYPSKHSAVLGQLNTLMLNSNTELIDGHNGKSFLELKNSVMDNSYKKDTKPITDKQLASEFHGLGYSFVKELDHVTKRVNLATKSLPAPTNLPFSEPISVKMALLGVVMEEIKDRSYVRDNYNRMTITSDAFFHYTEEGQTLMLDDFTINRLKDLDKVSITEFLNENTILKTPFHYVLDATGNDFEVRPYYLDEPRISNRTIIASNNNLGYSISTQEIAVGRSDTGYRIIVLALGNKDLASLRPEQVRLQLAIPNDSGIHGFVDARYLGNVEGKRTFEIIIDSNLDIDKEHQLYFDNLIYNNESSRSLPVSLNAELKLLYTINDIPVERTFEPIDSIINTRTLPLGSKVLTIDGFTLELGSHLKHLWANGLAIVKPEEYERHTTNKIRRYDKDYYELDENGRPKFTKDDDGKLNFIIKHRKGSEIYYEGQPVFEHRVGDYRLDNNGNRIPIAPRKIQHEIELVTLDARFHFNENSVIDNYYQNIPKLMVDWINRDIGHLASMLLERTHLYFYPKNTIGEIEISTDYSNREIIDSRQSLSLDIRVEPEIYTNSELQKDIRKTVRSIVVTEIKKSTIAISNLVETLRKALPDTVVDVSISGFAGSDKIRIVRITDAVGELNLAKRMFVESDNSLSIQDDITINFIPV